MQLTCALGSARRRDLAGSNPADRLVAGVREQLDGNTNPVRIATTLRPQQRLGADAYRSELAVDAHCVQRIASLRVAIGLGRRAAQAVRAGGVVQDIAAELTIGDTVVDLDPTAGRLDLPRLRFRVGAHVGGDVTVSLVVGFTAVAVVTGIGRHRHARSRHAGGHRRRVSPRTTAARHQDERCD